MAQKEVDTTINEVYQAQIRLERKELWKHAIETAAKGQHFLLAMVRDGTSPPELVTSSVHLWHRRLASHVFCRVS